LFLQAKYGKIYNSFKNKYLEIKDLQGKLVAILGYGMEGNATAAYLLKHGIKPVLFDQRPWKDWDEIEKSEIKKLGVNFIFGPDAFKELAGFEIAFRSPGVNPSHPDIQLRIKDKGLKMIVTSQTKWFFEHCPAKIIGVTGTKGKGTTASLIFEILKCSLPIYRLTERPINGQTTSEKAYLTGNIGKTQPLVILDDLKSEDYVVYELSSFQLQDLDRSPRIGVVLMVTSEHLDYHKNLEEYIEAKSAITKFQTADDFAVVNDDYENSAAIGRLGQGKKVYFNRRTELSGILAVKDLQLRGAHNLENVRAAVSVGKILEIPDDIIRKAVIEFKGLEHRLEFVAEKGGIKFYNDSFSTTPETAIAAIKSFTEPEILILGGSSKNSDFDSLGKTINASTNIKALVLIGEEAPKIRQAIGATRLNIIQGAKSMPEIFEQIKAVAQKGDAVILSPACASFGMFKNYKDRGEQFKKMVLGM